MDDLTSPTGREEALRALPRESGDGQGSSAPLALVLGATGYLGGRLVPRLLNGGYRVRVLARDAHRVAAFDWGSSVEVVEGDATDPSAVGEAVRGVDVLYYLVHSMGAGKGFESADRAAATTVADAAAAASVARIVYLGGLHPEGTELSPHLRSRVEVGQILLDSGVPT
ncbi:MAG: NAD(P)H-binding protein, partial [Myxococcota bacterium]